MEKIKMPRVMIAAPKSGSGKTMFTCGLLQALKNRQLNITSFKTGPDYIDPMFHREVLGIESGNLDSYFTDENTLKYIFARQSEGFDMAVIEGVMGFYDGLAGMSEKASSYEVAKITNTPVILLVDAKGASVTLAALIKGILSFRDDHKISGVVLNRVSQNYYERIAKVIEDECKIPVFGFLPNMPDTVLGSRHLGLYAPEEIEDFDKKINQIASQIEETVLVDKILDIAYAADELSYTDISLPKKYKVKIAVAKDEAFSFYYKENFELLKEAGAELVFFSPIHDEKLPMGVDGLILGGGYPENFAKELSENKEMKQSVKKAIDEGIPTLAECGGFLYLQKELESANGDVFPMVSVLSGKGKAKKGLRRFGYIETEILESGLLGAAGEKIKGHEFHHWDCTENGKSFVARKPLLNQEYECMVHTKTIAAGFPHFYYYANMELLENYLKMCEQFHDDEK